MNPMFRMWRCYFSGLLDAGRWRMFLHSRMWLGLPVAAVAAFVVIFLLRRFGEGLPTAEAFWKGAVYALVIAFCWALGVWAAVGPEPSDDDGRQDGEAVGNVGSRASYCCWGRSPWFARPRFRKCWAANVRWPAGSGGYCSRRWRLRPSLFPYGLIRDAVNGRINKSRCYVDPDVYKKDVAMNRKWIFAVVSVLAVALVMFPLNLLWVGQSPLHAAVSSLLFGLPALLTAWTPKGRCAGGRAESRRAAGNTGFRTRTGRPDRTVPEDRAVLPDHTVPADRTEPAGRKSLLAKVALGIAFFVLAAMLAYDISTEGIAVGVTKAVGFGLLILLAAVGYRLGYLKL